MLLDVTMLIKELIIWIHVDTCNYLAEKEHNNLNKRHMSACAPLAGSSKEEEC